MRIWRSDRCRFSAAAGAGLLDLRAAGEADGARRSRRCGRIDARSRSARSTSARCRSRSTTSVTRDWSRRCTWRAAPPSTRSSPTGCSTTKRRPRHRSRRARDAEITAKVEAPTDADIELLVSGQSGARAGRAARSGARADSSRCYRTSGRRRARRPPRRAEGEDDGHGAAGTAAPGRSPPPATPARSEHRRPIELIEFSDFQCPFCQRANPTVDQVLKTYGDQIRFVYRHYPLPNHPNARPAAEAAACADEQGQFWHVSRPAVRQCRRS